MFVGAVEVEELVSVKLVLVVFVDVVDELVFVHIDVLVFVHVDVLVFVEVDVLVLDDVVLLVDVVVVDWHKLSLVFLLYPSLHSQVPGELPPQLILFQWGSSHPQFAQV